MSQLIIKYEDWLSVFSTITETKKKQKKTKYSFENKCDIKYSFCHQELLEMNSGFCTKLQKSLEEFVAKGDEVINEYKAGAWLFLYYSGS